MRTFVPLLQLLLIEMGSLLEVGQLLLGEFALAVEWQNQLVILQLCVFYKAAESCLYLRLPSAICEHQLLQDFVARTSGMRDGRA